MEHRNGACWLDVEGKPIQAHGGMITRFGDTWYWYGENKDAENCTRDGAPLSRVDVIGVSCYTSPDLLHWTHQGVVLSAVTDSPVHPLHPSRVLERPKVFYNAPHPESMSCGSTRTVRTIPLPRRDAPWRTPRRTVPLSSHRSPQPPGLPGYDAVPRSGERS